MKWFDKSPDADSCQSPLTNKPVSKQLVPAHAIKSLAARYAKAAPRDEPGTLAQPSGFAVPEFRFGPDPPLVPPRVHARYAAAAGLPQGRQEHRQGRLGFADVHLRGRRGSVSGEETSPGPPVPAEVALSRVV